MSSEDEIEIDVNIVEMTKSILEGIQIGTRCDVESQIRKGVIQFFEAEGCLELLARDLENYYR